MHISLDSFVAGLNGELDWAKLDDEIFDFIASMTDNANTVLYVNFCMWHNCTSL